MAKRIVIAEQIEHLPSDLHKMVARALIARGEWIVVEQQNQTSGNCRMVVA